MIPVSRPNAKIAAAGTLGFASALLFVFLTGTLAGWFSELGISMTMIGLLSSITLAYAFKLLQAPLVQRRLHCWIVLSCSGLCGSGAEAELSDDEYERQSAKDRKLAILDTRRVSPNGSPVPEDGSSAFQLRRQISGPSWSRLNIPLPPSSDRSAPDI